MEDWIIDEDVLGEDLGAEVDRAQYLWEGEL